MVRMTTPNDPIDLPEQEATTNQVPEEQAQPATPEPSRSNRANQPSHKVKSSLAAGTWVALIVGLVLLILLLVFIIQNQQQAEVNLFAWTWQVPAGVAYLLSAIIGALIMALVGVWRMFELRRQIRHPRDN